VRGSENSKPTTSKRQGEVEKGGPVKDCPSYENVVSMKKRRTDASRAGSGGGRGDMEIPGTIPGRGEEPNYGCERQGYALQKG